MADKNQDVFTPEEMKLMVQDIMTKQKTSEPTQEWPMSATGRRRGLSDEESRRELRRYGWQRELTFESSTRDERVERVSVLDETMPDILAAKLYPLATSIWQTISLDSADIDTRVRLDDMFLQLISLTSNEMLTGLKNCLTRVQSPPALVSNDTVKEALYPFFKSCFRIRSVEERKSFEQFVEMLSAEVKNHVNSELTLFGLTEERHTTEGCILRSMIWHAKKFVLRRPPQTVCPDETPPVASTSQEQTNTRAESSCEKLLSAEEQLAAKRLRLREELKRNGLGMRSSLQSPTEDNPSQSCVSWTPDSTLSRGDVHMRPYTEPSRIRLSSCLPSVTDTPKKEKQDEDPAPTDVRVQSSGPTFVPEPLEEKEQTRVTPMKQSTPASLKPPQSGGPCVLSKEHKGQTLSQREKKQKKDNHGSKLSQSCVPCVLSKEHKVQALSSLLSSTSPVPSKKNQEEDKEQRAKSFSSTPAKQPKPTSLKSQREKKQKDNHGAKLSQSCEPCVLSKEHKGQALSSLRSSTPPVPSKENQKEDMEQLAKSSNATPAQQPKPTSLKSQREKEQKKDNLGSKLSQSCEPCVLSKEHKGLALSSPLSCSPSMPSEKKKEMKPPSKPKVQSSGATPQLEPTRPSPKPSIDKVQQSPLAAAQTPSKNLLTNKSENAQNSPNIYLRGPTVVCVMTEKPTAPVPSQQTSCLHLQCEWETHHIRALALEISQRVMKTKDIQTIRPFYEQLSQHLEANVTIHDCTIRPNPENIVAIAEVVYKDLCLGKRKVMVKFNALTNQNYIWTITDTIHTHVQSPLPKRSRLQSVSRSVRSFFRRPFRGH
ncbi:hypothetical protein WMY93_015156 [Mugilogobius chulae]|uniref:Uncharacterized protein n=1 Tax=Mugilogobius chulae TaxID=88201 RepID=A0AAW0NX32_9GOBI